MTTYLPSSNKFAIACGAGGAFVDVSDRVFFNEGSITRTWGRTAPFSDAAPSTFSFTLDNSDGRFTPGTATPVSPVLTRLTEGMGVSWELNGQLRYGQIRSLPMVFPDTGAPSTLRLRITVTDSLAIAARTTLSYLPESVVLGAKAFLYWPLSDPAGSFSAAERSGSGAGNATLNVDADSFTNFVPTFGVSPSITDGVTCLSANFATNPLGFALRTGTLTAANAYGTGTGNLGYYTFIVTPTTTSDVVRLSAQLAGLAASIQFGVENGNYIVYAGLNSTWQPIPEYNKTVQITLELTQAGGGGITATVYIDPLGIVLTTAYSQTPTPIPTPLTDAQKSPSSMRLVMGSSGGPTAAKVQSIAHTRQRANALLASGPTTEYQRLLSIADAASLTITTDGTDVADFSASVGAPESDGMSALDALNEIIRGQQGHLYTTVSGTLLAPVETVQIAGRVRPEAVTATFVTTEDIIGEPEIGRNTTNTVSSVDVSGSVDRVRVTNIALIPRVGSANTSTQLDLLSPVDLRSWGEDRILRGLNDGIDVFSITINARETKTNRWATLLSLTPGLRYRVAGLPSTQLGIATWDGWFLGATETHTPQENLFTLYFERVLPRTAIFDTDRFMSGGGLSLTANINAVATSLSVAAADLVSYFTTAGGDLPRDVVMGAEQMRVTAASGAIPQVLTVTRGVNGTTAVAHVAGETLELVSQSLFAF